MENKHDEPTHRPPSLENAVDSLLQPNPPASEDKGAHDTRTIDTGETVHLIRHPHGKWRVSSYEWSWVDWPTLMTARVAAHNIGWDSREFETPEDAYAFVSQQIATKAVSGRSRQA